jgi:hypothetical protein
MARRCLGIKITSAITIAILVFFLLSVPVGAEAVDFCAYYTKLNSGEPFEEHYRAGQFADLVVNVNEGEQLRFWRASSYLPHWKTAAGTWYLDEFTQRRGDGTDRMPDKFNKYSKIRVIENNGARVVVHWRYAPDLSNVKLADYVDEYFTVYPDGVLVRTFRKGAEKLDEWAGPWNLKVVQLRLASEGIKTLPRAWMEAPDLTAVSGGYINEGFDMTTRSYVLKCKKNGMPSRLNFKLGRGSHNPVVVVQNWGDARVSGVEIDGAEFTNYAAGFEHDRESTDLVLWLGKEARGAISVTITPDEASIMPPANKAPVVSAGNDRSVLVASDSSGPYAVKLAGTVDDDGLPSDNLSVRWSKVSGPGTAGFDSAARASTEVSFDRSGTYVLRVTADDGDKQAGDDVVVLVKKDEGAVVEPIVWWRFDEGEGEQTTESVSKYTDDIAGDKSIWAAGVSGSALVFNGWSSVVSLPAEKAPFLYRRFNREVDTEQFSLEAWVAIKAYPWNWAPIVQQCDWGKNGYFLGVDYFGHLGFKMASGGAWFDLVSTRVLPRNRWVHVAATYERASGMMYIYIDGEKAGELEASGRELFMAASNSRAAELDVRVGKGVAMKPAMPIRPFFTDVSEFAFDGALDEVKIYDKVLTAEDVMESYRRNAPSAVQRDDPDLQGRVLPGGPSGTGKFGAYYTKLKFYDTWDNRWRVGDHSDVVVQFDEVPVKFVFWRGTSYIPHWVTENNIWATQEFTESGTDYGCAEPMSDKESRHSYVRIIESTDARVVLHWRYALVDVKYTGANPDPRTGWFDWTDEYHYVYPDGVAVRVQNAWSIKPEDREWHEGIILNGPEQRPEDNLEVETMTLANMNGETHTYSWENGPPQGAYREGGMPYPKGRNIAVMHLKAEYDPFVIGPPSDELILAAYNDPREFTKYSVFSWFNHWPMSYVISDGHHAQTIDRTTSTSMFWLDTRDAFFKKTDNLAVKIYLNGMTNEPTANLATLAKSWLQAPAVAATRECESQGYDQSQRAHVLAAKASTMSFRLDASDDNPIINPCFVMKNWGGSEKAGLKVNGKTVPEGKDFRQGIVRDTDGERMLVVWVKAESEKPMEVSISKVGG